VCQDGVVAAEVLGFQERRQEELRVYEPQYFPISQA
jgi:hypothetical protein